MSARLKPVQLEADNPVITVTEVGAEWKLKLRAIFPNGVEWNDQETIQQFSLIPLAWRVRVRRWMLWRRYQIFLRACTIKGGQ